MANDINAALGTDAQRMARRQKTDQPQDQNQYTEQASDTIRSELGRQTQPEPGSTSTYDDISGSKESYSPNPEGLANTGSGAEAAVGTTYSWDKSAGEKAKSTYSSDVIGAKQQLLNNRQTIETNAVNYQKQADMQKYVDSQNAEKVGWTGGYVLDQRRQSEYLKQSIQAQMYGAMELQKYGYDSALAAARLSYDINQQEYARQYYNEAVSAALSEAQLTGTYFSAETKDMMSQLAVAQQKLDDPSLSQEERDRAEKVRSTIVNWFSANGISEQGVKTLEAWQAEQNQELAWSQELWTRYQAALESANTDISNDSNSFIMLDSQGREMFDGANVQTGNWETMSGDDILKYVTTSPQAMNQYYGYLDSTLTGMAESGFSKWCQSKGYITQDDKGNTQINTNNFPVLFANYLAESGIINQFQNKFEGKSESEVYKTIGNWDFTVTMPDGTTVTKTYNEILANSANKVTGGTVATVTGQSDNNDGTFTDYSWASQTGTTEKQGYTSSSYYKTALTKGSLAGKNICITTGKCVSVDSPDHTSVGTAESDDIAVCLYHGDTESQEGGYNVEIKDGISQLAFTPDTEEGKEIKAYFQQTTGKGPQNGSLIVVNGSMYIYNETNSGPYPKLNSGWLEVDGQCGSSSLKSALTSSGQWVS